MSPIRAPSACTISLEIAAHIGAARLVPPQQQSITAPPPESSPRNTPGLSGLAIIAMSGTSRLPSAGVTPLCHEGLEKTVLTPPPVAPIVGFVGSSQTCSATEPTSLWDASKVGLNCV